MDCSRRQLETVRLEALQTIQTQFLGLSMYEGPQTLQDAVSQLEALSTILKGKVPAEMNDLVKVLLRVLILTPQKSLWESFLENYLKWLWESPRESNVCRVLVTLGFDDLVTEVTHTFVQASLSQEVTAYNGRLEEEALGPLEEWSKTRLVPWIGQLGLPDLGSGVFTEVCKQLGTLRIDQLYDIVLEYPASKPALTDLATCLLRVSDLTQVLETRLVQQMTARATSPSKPTEGILLLYINLSKAMKHLFTTIEVLEAAAEPLKKALRSRSDTFRCIIQSIAEDSELYQMLDIKQKNIKELDDFSSEEDESAAAEWQPIPRSAVRSVISALNKRSDLVSMLVNIYGSPEQFMDDYRSFLAQKLMDARDFQANAELKDLEMLKKRFGEANVHKCEVMLQDVANSKRINSFIHELPGCPVHTLIISSYFWPIEESEAHFKLPATLQTAFDWYSKRYSVARASRKLKFHEMMGQVTVTLEFDNGSKTWADVSPLHAAIVALFNEDEGRKSAEEMANALGISVGLLRKEVAVWEGRGVLHKVKEGEEVFYVAARSL